MTRVIYSFRHVIALKLQIKCCFAFKRRTSVTQTLVVMAGSAQKQMEHTFVPVWKDTKESTVKVFFYTCLVYNDLNDCKSNAYCYYGNGNKL